MRFFILKLLINLFAVSSGYAAFRMCYPARQTLPDRLQLIPSMSTLMFVVLHPLS